MHNVGLLTKSTEIKTKHNSISNVSFRKLVHKELPSKVLRVYIGGKCYYLMPR